MFSVHKVSNMDFFFWAISGPSHHYIIIIFFFLRKQHQWRSWVFLKSLLRWVGIRDFFQSQLFFPTHHISSFFIGIREKVQIGWISRGSRKFSSITSIILLFIVIVCILYFIMMCILKYHFGKWMCFYCIQNSCIFMFRTQTSAAGKPGSGPPKPTTALEYTHAKREEGKVGHRHYRCILCPVSWIIAILSSPMIRSQCTIYLPMVTRRTPTISGFWYMKSKVWAVGDEEGWHSLKHEDLILPVCSRGVFKERESSFFFLSFPTPPPSFVPKGRPRAGPVVGWSRKWKCRKSHF